MRAPPSSRVGATGGMSSRSERLAAPAAIAALLVMCAVTAAITVSGSTAEYVWLDACARVLMVGAPIAVGLYARRRPASRRFGDLLIAAGAGWFVASFSSSDDPVLYSIGRVAGWLVEVALVYLVLAFPSGVLGRVDRALVRATVLVVALLYLPTALLVEHYPTPSPLAACVDDCPGNAFMLLGSEPAFVENVVRPIRELLTVLIFAAATLRLAWRIEHASHLLRRSLTPVLAVAIFRLAALAVGIAARQLAPASHVAEVLTWVIALALPALAIAFLVGLVRWRLFIAAAMERLAARLSRHPGPDDLRDALADAFDDPTLEVVYWLEVPEGHWADADGGSVRPTAARLRPGGHRGPRRRAARRGDRPRPGAGARPRVRRRRHVVRVDHARQPSPRGPDVGAPDRGAGVARPHPGGGGPGAAADRARPARRGPATARDAADQAGARRGAVRRRRRHRRRDAAGARPRGRRGARRGAIAGARHLSRAAGVARPRRGAARGRAAHRAAGLGPGRRRRALLARGRARRVLLLPRGDAERRQARHGRDRDRRS